MELNSLCDGFLFNSFKECIMIQKNHQLEYTLVFCFLQFLDYVKAIRSRMDRERGIY